MQIGIQNNDVVQVAQFITSNSIPLPFVIMLILQFLSMLADRYGTRLLQQQRAGTYIVAGYADLTILLLNFGHLLVNAIAYWFFFKRCWMLF